MQFSDVRIRLISNPESKLKAVASITIDDCFVVHDIKVLEGSQGYFVSMPSRKTPDGEYNEEFIKVKETLANFTGEEALKFFKYDYDTSEKLHTLVPILGGGKRWGTLILTRYSPEFTAEDLALAVDLHAHNAAARGRFIFARVQFFLHLHHRFIIFTICIFFLNCLNFRRHFCIHF